MFGTLGSSVWDADYYGSGYLKGGPETDPDSGIFVLTVPARKRYFLIHRRTHRVLRDAFSGADGALRIEYLKNDQYAIVAWDETGQYNDVIAGPLYVVKDHSIEGTPSAGQVVQLPVAPILFAICVDANDTELGTPTQYTVSLANGTVTFSTPLSLEGLSAPFKVIFSHPHIE